MVAKEIETGSRKEREREREESKVLNRGRVYYRVLVVT